MCAASTINGLMYIKELGWMVYVTIFKMFEPFSIPENLYKLF